MNTVLSTPNTSVPQHVLRRLAQRGIRVIERHVAKSEAIALHRDTFVPLALDYIDTFDATRFVQPERGKELAESRHASAELRTVMTAWSGHLRRDLPGFHVGPLGGKTPDDLIATARAMTSQIARHVQGTAAPIAYADQAIAAIEAAREDAIKEWKEAEALLTSHQEQLATVRRLAAQLQQALVALRRTLRAVLGDNHRDYHKLRLRRASVLDDEDPEVEAGVGRSGDPVPAPAAVGSSELVVVDAKDEREPATS